MEYFQDIVTRLRDGIYCNTLNGSTEVSDTEDPRLSKRGKTNGRLVPVSTQLGWPCPELFLDTIFDIVLDSEYTLADPQAKDKIYALRSKCQVFCG